MSKAKAQEELNKQFKAGIISQKEMTALSNQLKNSTEEAASGMLKMLRTTKSVVKEFEKLDKVSQSIKNNESELIDITSKLQQGLKGNLRDFEGIGKKTLNIAQNLVQQYRYQLNTNKITKHTYKELVKTAAEAARIADSLDKIAGSGLAAEFDAAQAHATTLSGKIASAFDSIPGGGVLFKALGGDKLQQQLSSAVTAGFAELASGKGPVAAMQKFSETANKLPMIGTLMGLGAAIVLATALAAIFLGISHAAHDLSKETGLTYTASKKLVKESTKLLATGGTQLATTEDILSVQKEINKEFGIGSMLSTKQAAAVADIGEAFGYGAEQAGKVNAAFMAMGASATDATNSQRELAAESLKAGVNVGAVTADIADSAKEVAFYFKGNVKALGKAAVEAAKMGISLKDMAKISEGLLNFEDSISAQFELQALTGKQINLDTARELALKGDILGASKAVLKEAGSLADLQAMGPLEMKALEKATGMNADQLLRSATIQEKMAGLDDDAKAAALSLGLSAEDMANMSAEQLQAKAAEADKQKMLTKEMKAMQASLVVALLPAAQKMMEVFKSLIPVFKLIGSGIALAMEPLAYAADKAKDIFNYIKQSVPAIVAAGVGYLAILNYQKSGLIVNKAIAAVEAVKLGYKNMQIAKEKLSQAIQAKGFFKGLAEAAMAAFRAVAGIPIVGPLLGAAAAGSAVALGMSLFKKTGDVMSPAKGKTRVSTKEGGLFELSKNDDLMAGPGLANGNGGGGGGVAQALATTNALLRQILEQGTTIEMDGQLVAQAIRTSDSFRRK